MTMIENATSELQALKSDIRFKSKEFTEEFIKQIEVQSGSKSLAVFLKSILEN